MIAGQTAKMGLAVLVLGVAWWGTSHPAQQRIGTKRVPELNHFERNGTGHPAQQPEGTLWVDAASPYAIEVGSAAFPFRSITKALAAASPGYVLRVRAGEYRENIIVGDGLALVGEGLPVLRAADASRPVVIMRGKTVLRSFRVTGGEDGIIVDVNTDALILDCEIVDNRDDGIGFQLARQPGEAPATVHIKRCLVSGNQDGIDLEDTRGVVRKCRLIKNRDDGLDYDGDTDCNAIDNEIRDNRDDGIEIRLQRNTRASIRRNILTGNGEDGIEIINTPVAGTTENRLRIVRNTISKNVRYGIGGVDQKTEEVEEGLVIAGVALRQNVVEGNRKEQIAGQFAR